jgi:uncharacterized protein
LNAERIRTLDAVRGVAVMGILLMNIVALGMPSAAYTHPTSYGTHAPADWAVWTINYIFSDGKFRALFTMLFGASMVVIAERAEADADGPGPAMTHYRRMFWLFVIGMVHAWCFWYGDILVQYAAGGALGYLLWRWPPRALWLVFAAMLALQTAASLAPYAELAPVRAAAIAPGARPQAIATWEKRVASGAPSAREIAAEVADYRGDLKSAFETRAKTTIFFLRVVTPITMPEIFAFMALGILFLRNGFLTGAWSSRSYAIAIGVGYLIAVPLTAALANMLRSSDFDPAIQALCEGVSLPLRPFIGIAHAAVVIMLIRANIAPRLLNRIEAIGRMALSNYLGTTLIATTFFYGYGFGWFGYLDRAELYIVVAAIWAAMLFWSKPWVARFHYGPAEWLWRSLARWQWQPMRR